MSRHHDRGYQSTQFQIHEGKGGSEITRSKAPARQRPRDARKYVIELLGLSAMVVYEDIARRARGAKYYLEYFGDHAGRLYVYATKATYQVMESLSLRIAAA